MPQLHTLLMALWWMFDCLNDLCFMNIIPRNRKSTLQWDGVSMTRAHLLQVRKTSLAEEQKCQLD